ncbi:MAG TPA: cupin domain-containing protein [Stenomitos sp.]
MQSPFILGNLFEIESCQDTLPWQPFRDGVEIYPLYSDGEFGSSAALLRYQPGARIPRHEHQGFEHIIILSGAQSDFYGEYNAGTLVINPPSSNHQVVSQGGCIVLIIWEKPVHLWQ